MRLYAYQIGQAIKIGLETEVSTEARRKDLRRLANAVATITGAATAPEVVEIFSHGIEDRSTAYVVDRAIKLRFKENALLESDWLKATEENLKFFNGVKDNTGWLEEWAKKLLNR